MAKLLARKHHIGQHPLSRHCGNSYIVCSFRLFSSGVSLVYVLLTCYWRHHFVLFWAAPKVCCTYKPSGDGGGDDDGYRLLVNVIGCCYASGTDLKGVDIDEEILWFLCRGFDFEEFDPRKWYCFTWKLALFATNSINFTCSCIVLHSLLLLFCGLHVGTCTCTCTCNCNFVAWKVNVMCPDTRTGDYVSCICL